MSLVAVITPFWCYAILLLALFISKDSIISAGCPNRCSGHGKCNSESQCVCESLFTGSDCSWSKLSIQTEVCCLSKSNNVDFGIMM